MTELDPLDSRERELAATLRATLERKASQPDPLLDAALAATRAQIASRPTRHQRQRWWLAGGFALAASVAVMVVLPFGQSPPQPAAPKVAEMPMPDADLQFLSDLDLLVAMDEGRHEG